MWRYRGLVLKPADTSDDALHWLEAELNTFADNEIRISGPVRSRAGELIVEGWTAWRYLPGTPNRDRWRDIIDAGEAFSDSFGRCECPPHLRGRTDPWAVADRIAWGAAAELDVSGSPLLQHLQQQLAPIDGVPGIIHGDLTGNVLFHPTLPPAVIDLSLYWRPRDYASAIVLADTALATGVTAELRHFVDQIPGMSQLVLRALIFRLATDYISDPQSPRSPSRALDDSATTFDSLIGGASG